MKWFLRGLFKGFLLGAVLGVVFTLVDRAHHMFWTKLLLGGTVGAVVAAAVGKPLWRDVGHGLPKAAVGAAVGAVVVAVAYWVEPTGFLVTRWTSGYVSIAALFGAAWGALVGLDEKA